MPEAPRQIQQHAGETRARGTATDAVEHFRALPRRAEEEQNRHQPALKVAVLPWRFCPTFLGVMRWRTKDAPDCAMRCRLAPIPAALCGRLGRPPLRGPLLPRPRWGTLPPFDDLPRLPAPL